MKRTKPTGLKLNVTVLKNTTDHKTELEDDLTDMWTGQCVNSGCKCKSMTGLVIIQENMQIETRRVEFIYFF